MKGVVLIYDGTFNGFLTTIFDIYEERISDFVIVAEGTAQNLLFAEKKIIYTDQIKSKRVLNGIKKYSSPKISIYLYRAWLSEITGIEHLIYQFCEYLFKEKKDISTDFSNPSILKIAQINKKVRREKHRMEAFVRFELLKDDIFFAKISPDFNILPLILNHFKTRFADQKWIIYDLKRNIGIYYDLKKTSFISINFKEKQLNTNDILKNTDKNYQILWKSYFESTTIRSRKNMKLHLQHVPKRYWKFLTEKTVTIQ